MDLITIAKLVVDLGLIPILLLVFVKNFFDKDKERDRQLNEQNTQFEKREELLRADMTRREEQCRERERILVAESARREEILKKESEKREKIIRDESEKRESSLLAAIDSFSKTMKEISETMTGIKNTTMQMQSKIDNMGNTLERLSKGGGSNG